MSYNKNGSSFLKSVHPTVNSNIKVELLWKIVLPKLSEGSKFL